MASSVVGVFWLGGIVGLALGGLGVVAISRVQKRRPVPKQRRDPPLTTLTEGHERWLRLALELKKQHMDRFFQRRQVEWRVSLALWGGISISANAFRDANLSDGAETFLRAVAVVLFLLHLGWAWAFNHRAAKPNRTAGRDLENAIRDRMGLERMQSLSYLGFFAHFWQVSVTGVLLWGAHYLITTP